MSLFANRRATKPNGALTLAELVQGVREGTWRDEVIECRTILACDGVEAYKASRNKVRAVTISASLEHRRKKSTPEQRGAVHSGFLQLDFDAKDHPGMAVDKIRSIVQAAPFVVACFLSISGEAMKGIARIPASIETHPGSWEAADKYFKELGLTLDTATKDYSRLCFVSYDPKAWQNLDAEELEPVPLPEKSEHGKSSEGEEDPEHVRRVLAQLAEKIGAYQNRSTWIHIVGSTVDAVGPDQAGEIVDEFFPPQKDGDQSACDVAHGLNGSWLSLRKYEIDPVDYLKFLPDVVEIEDENGKQTQEKTKAHPTLVWGVNSFPAIVQPETVVLGNAWLRRSDIAHFISTAGAGKSVGVIQASMAWALGLPYFGIRPPGPLRILLFSGEDDRTTLGQCRDGFLEHSEAITGQRLTAADLEPLDSMLRTEFSREHVGTGFHAHLVRLLKESPADLVIVNPLLSFIGGEIVACASEWLRKGLMPVLQKHDCAALIAHHTGKMAKDGWDNTDDTYAGIGGGEVANVPRTLLVLRPTNTEGLFVLKVCKRKTTGWKDDEGNFTSSYFMKQSRDPELPAWIPVAHIEAHELVSASKSTSGTGASRRKVTSGHVVETLIGGPVKRQDLIEMLKAKCRCSEKPAKDAINTAEFDGLVSSFTEANPNGGHPIKWFQVSEDEVQGVV